MDSKVYKNFSTYQVNIHFQMGANKIKLINQKFNLELNDDFEGIAEKITNYDYLIFINSDTINISLLAHELLHLTDLIVSTFEKEISIEGNTETRARIMEQIISKIIKDFKDFVGYC